MSRTTISIQDTTKDRLERLKRDDESFDELLRRLAGDEQPVEVGRWDEEDLERGMEAREKSKESFGL